MFWLESNGVLCLPGLIMSGLVNCSQFVAPCKQQADGEKVEGGEGGTEGGGGGEDGMPQLLLLKVNVWPEFWAFLLLSLVQLTACQAEKYFQFFSPHYTVTIWLISSMGNIEAPLTLRQTEAGLCLISTTSNWPTTSPLHIRQHFGVLWCRKLVQIIKFFLFLFPVQSDKAPCFYFDKLMICLHDFDKLQVSDCKSILFLHPEGWHPLTLCPAPHK